jgi:hypothetical protein
LAVTTTRSPGAIHGRCKRQISRNLRRTRLRVTASPRRREVIRPKRVSPTAGSPATLKRNKRPCAVCPCDRTRANSRLRLMRTARGKRSLSGFGVPGVGDLDTLGQQAFATALATAAQNRAAALRFHSSAKTELALTRALAWLIGAFHKIGKMEPARITFRPRESIQESRLESRCAIRAESLQPKIVATLNRLSAGGPRRSDKVRQSRASRVPGTDQSP